MIKTKICTLCKKEKSVEVFYPNKACKDGLHTRCKACTIVRLKEYYEANPDYQVRVNQNTARVNEKSKRKASSHSLPWTKAEDDVIREYWATDPVLEIAEVLGRTYHAVKYRAKVLGVRKTLQHPADQ